VIRVAAPAEAFLLPLLQLWLQLQLSIHMLT